MRLEQSIIPYTPCLDLPEDPWLVISPHPDDETFGIGGLLRKGFLKGFRINLIVLTGGELQGDAEERRRETLDALRVLGGEGVVEFWDYPDRGVSQEIKELYEDLKKALSKKRPTSIFVTSPMDIHPDHRAASKAVFYAAKEVLPRSKVYFYETLRESEVNLLFPMSGEEFAVKMRAMEAYRSQIPYGYKWIVEAINRLRALTVQGFDFCEGVYRVGERIPLSFLEYWLEMEFKRREDLKALASSFYRLLKGVPE